MNALQKDIEQTIDALRSEKSDPGKDRLSRLDTLMELDETLVQIDAGLIDDNRTSIKRKITALERKLGWSPGWHRRQANDWIHRTLRRSDRQATHQVKEPQVVLIMDEEGDQRFLLTDAVIQAYADRGGCMALLPDEAAATHPDQLFLQSGPDEAAAARLNQDLAVWGCRVLEDVRGQGCHLVMRGPLREGQLHSQAIAFFEEAPEAWTLHANGRLATWEVADMGAEEEAAPPDEMQVDSAGGKFKLVGFGAAPDIGETSPPPAQGATSPSRGRRSSFHRAKSAPEDLPNGDSGEEIAIKQGVTMADAESPVSRPTPPSPVAPRKSYEEMDGDERRAVDRRKELQARIRRFVQEQ